uniref:HTH Mu-type domain-containing protein n=1 Tax=Oryza punctata TaxID=4537 RepID=A0A0E0L014_ORYPU
MEYAATTVEALPDDVVEEIILRLPPQSIGRRRAVCKAWLSCTSAPTSPVPRPSSVAMGTTETPYGTRACTTVRIKRLGDESSRPASCAVSFASLRWQSMISVIGFWDGVLCAARVVLERLAWVDQCVLCNPLTVVLAPATGGFLLGGYAHPTTLRFHLSCTSRQWIPSGSCDSGRTIAPPILQHGTGGIPTDGDSLAMGVARELGAGNENTCTSPNTAASYAPSLTRRGYSDDPRSWRLQWCGAAGVLSGPDGARILFVPASRQLLWWRCYPMASMAMTVTRRSLLQFGVRILQPAAGRCLMMRRQCILPREVSLGPRGKDIDGYCCYHI